MRLEEFDKRLRLPEMVFGIHGGGVMACTELIQVEKCEGTGKDGQEGTAAFANNKRIEKGGARSKQSQCYKKLLADHRAGLNLGEKGKHAIQHAEERKHDECGGSTGDNEERLSPHGLLASRRGTLDQGME